LSDGNPFKLEPFQKRILAGYFAGATETLILLPKKNGKSTLLAALALYHLLRTPEANIPVVASSAGQAMWIFDQARGFVERSPEVFQDVRVLRGIREIRRRDPEGEKGPKNIVGVMKVFANDEDTIDGVIPTLAIVDEYHRHPKASTYGVLRDGLVGDAAMITISTAGSRRESPLGGLRAKAHALENFTRRGCYNHATQPDGSFDFHEWCLDEGADVTDVEVVKGANPSSIQTRARLENRRISPSMLPAQWLRFACGIWTEGDNPWIEPTMWDELAVDVGGLNDGDEVFVGVRAGAGAGIGIVAPREDGAVAVRAKVLPPPPGGRVPLEAVEFALRRIAERYRVVEIGFDPDQFQRSADLLQEAGLPMMEVPQRPQRLAAATATLWRLVSARLLHHDGDPELRAQVLAGQTKESTTGWRLEPTAQTAALIALAMAVHRATAQPDETPAFVAL
jgi:phage terminase large subunit-like protein